MIISQGYHTYLTLQLTNGRTMPLNDAVQMVNGLLVFSYLWGVCANGIAQSLHLIL